jgi:outer membrane protein assembly factor BamA
MRAFSLILLLFLAGVCLHNARAQAPAHPVPRDSSKISTDEQGPAKRGQRDIIDILARWVNSPGISKHDTLTKKTTGRYHVSLAPGIGYSLSTGFGAIIATNTAFYTTNDESSKLSNVFADIVYTQNEQFILHTQGNIWTKDNAYNIVTDWRYLKYPQKTYGLGMNTDIDRALDQDYQYVRMYTTVLKNLGNSFYAGVGYSLDYHYNITSTGDPSLVPEVTVSDAPKKTTSSGINFNLLYDNRDNSINPDRGAYISVLYRPNFTFLGSDENWQSLRIDIRKYVRFPANSKNVLAFWSFNWLTPSGNSPYLDLPSTGWDPYNNSGRGYIQGRYRGKNMLYLETEYRFGVTHNGLIGGVVFVNAETFSEPITNSFNGIAPAAGFGMRLKFNKHSKTNVAIDYGFGTNGSQGFFVNLGEVF